MRRSRLRSYQSLLFLAQLRGRIVTVAWTLVDRGDRAPRAAQPHPERARPGQPLEERVQLRALAEHRDLEIVATQAADAPPTGERRRVEHDRPARRGGGRGVELVPPPVRVGRRDAGGRDGDEGWGRRQRREPEQPLSPAPAECGRRATGEKRDVAAEPRGEVE